jgi:Ca-activated chloride channel homolog
MARTIVVSLLLLGLFAQKPSQPEQPYTLSVDVDLALFNVAVHDKGGRIVSGLTQDSFRIYEDGKKQEIRIFRPEDIPATVGLIIDNSGSMNNKRREVIKAASAFLAESNPHDELFIVNFNDRVSLGLPDGMPFSGNSVELRRALLSIDANGQTALYDGIAAGLAHLEKGRHPKKALIVLSDGGDNVSRHKLTDVLKMAQQSSATIYTIGIYDINERDRNIKVLKEIAKTTGGEAYIPRTTTQLADIWHRIAGGIRSQYTLGYVSTNSNRDGAFRTVKISVVDKNGKPLEVRTRPGYVVGP